MLNFDEVEALLGQRLASRLVAIDGLPLAGKSTLAARLADTFGLDCVHLDDFIKPEADWPSRNTPSFPFGYIRYDEFLAAVTSLARAGICSYRPYDWSTGRVDTPLREVRADRPVIVEGVSALHPALAPLYDLRFWVESDADTVLSASTARGVGPWEREWREMFIPSVELYLETEPKARADFVVIGRGAQ